MLVVSSTCTRVHKRQLRYVERIFTNFLSDIQRSATATSTKTFTVDTFVNVFYNAFIKTVFDNNNTGTDSTHNSNNTNNKDYTTYVKRYVVSKSV